MSRAALVLTLLVFFTRPSAAQEPQSDQPFKRLTIDELSRIDVTSVSKHSEPVWEAAAAVVIVTGDDIRRSGVRTLPDALRLAIGVAVSQYDGHTWAITSRGFNAPTANKMVVMIDGRSLYTPLFSGVFWDVQDLPLADIDRIEVIRGPGGTLWGANAVNGVINIITKPARDTTGTRVTMRLGPDLGDLTADYGRGAGDRVAYRVFAKLRNRAGQEFASGVDAKDPLRGAQAGFRVDAESSAHTSYTLQGDAYGTSSGVFDRAAITMSGGNVLWRAVHTQDSGAQLRLQGYYDATSRDVPRQYAERRDTLNGEAEYHFPVGDRHDIVTGAGVDVARSDTTGTSVLYFDPQDRWTTLVNAFAQDEIGFAERRAHLILGSKFEHNDYTGFEVQPNARLRWTPGPRQTTWAAVSRAVRMPTRFDVDLRFPGGSPIVLLRGDAAFQSEVGLSYEAGYRRVLSSRWSIDGATFLNDYDRLRTQERTPPLGVPIVLGNKSSGRVSGVELSSRFQAAAGWQLQAGYSWLHETFRFAPDSRDSTGGVFEHNDPRHQAWLQAFGSIGQRFEANLFARAVDELPAPRVPAYVELNAHFEWRVSPEWRVALAGENLLHPSHLEIVGQAPPEPVPRRVFAHLTWQFRTRAGS